MKKVIKAILISAISLTIIFLGLFFVQNELMKKSFIKFYGLEDTTEKNKPYSFQRCNINIFTPEYAYVTGKNMALINFYNPKTLFSQTSEEWKNSRIGGTTIKNTTFPELVVMVKDDCEQFQKGKGDYWGEDIAWSHTPAPTQEELDERHIDSMRSDFIDLSEESREIFYRIYEVIHKDMIVGDEKTLEIYNKIEEDGGLHVDVQTQIQLEEDEYQRKVESGEIVEKTKVERMREANIDEEIIKLYVEQNGGVYVAPE